MRWIVALCLLVVGFVLALAQPEPKTTKPPRPKIEMIVEGRGRIVFELFPEKAPLHVAHFTKLARQGWYDRTLFHRKVAGFVIQGGDPFSAGMTPEEARSKPGTNGGTVGLGEGTSGYPVKFEKNDVKHLVGTLGMASEGAGTDTGDSQFFIDLARNKRLDGRFVAFGRVVEGLDVVMKLERGDRILTVRPLDEAVAIPMVPLDEPEIED